MRVGWFRIAGGSLASLALLLGGCAERYEEAEYPKQPAQAATEPIRSSPSLSSLETNPANPGGPSNEIAIGVDEKNYADTDPTALTEFRTTLEPYGTWSDDPNYGVVWQPSIATVGTDFTPYVSAGHWVYEDDWIWVSDYAWGWAPFHYGRWVHIPGRGWAWIPGRTYRGAWVTWRVGYGPYDYIGWAPMTPTWYWRGGYAVGIYVTPPPTYYYCPHRDVFNPVIGSRIIPPARVPAIAAVTRPYMPGDRAIEGARAIGAPSGNGRVAAQPGVGGVGAGAGVMVGGAHGPPPASLGIPEQAIAHPAAGDSGLNRARAFSTPSTAVAVGARPPQGFAHLEGPSPGRVVAGPQPLPVMPDGRTVRIGANGQIVPSGPIRLPDRGGVSPAYVGPHPYALPPRAGQPYVAPSSQYALPSFHSSGPTFPTSTFRPPTYHPPAYVPPSAPVFHSPPPMPSFHGGGAGGHVGGSPSVGAGPGRAVGHPR